MRFLLFLGLAPLLGASTWAAAPRGALHAATPLPLGDGESLIYHVSWAFLPGIGEIKVAGRRTTDAFGAPQLRVVTTTASRGVAHLLLPFELRGESLFDAATGRLVALDEWTEKRNRLSVHTVNFDYAHRVAKYTVPGDSPDGRLLALPPGNPTDLITCLLEARTWNLKAGESRDALVLFEDDFYELTIHALGYETITTPLGTFFTQVLEPRMEKTPPKGMFRHGSTVRVWISLDPRRLPVRFEVQFKFGTGMATLLEYQPPKAPSTPLRAGRK